VLEAAKKVLEKALETATKVLGLKETESATANQAQKQMKELMQKALAECKEDLNKLFEEFKGQGAEAGTEMLVHLAMGSDAPRRMSTRRRRGEADPGQPVQSGQAPAESAQARRAAEAARRREGQARDRRIR